MTGSISSFIAEPLGPEHDRASFTCESEAVERYLKQQANQDIRKDLSITYVLVPSGDRRRIAGYYTLCSDTILIDDLPADLVLKLRLPRYRTIPATLIGRLARDLAPPDSFHRHVEAPRRIGEWRESEILMKLSCLIVFGVDGDGPRAHGLADLPCKPQGIRQQQLAKALSFEGIVG